MLKKMEDFIYYNGKGRERIKQDETRDRERLLCVRYGNVYYGNRRNRGNDRGKKSLGRFTVKSPD